VRINKFIASNSSLSRRRADEAIISGRVEINGLLARPGDIIVDTDTVTLDSHVITPSVKTLMLILNKPVGYVVSRDGQGSQTVYDLLPNKFHNLNPVGRLDKDSSGLLLLTNDGNLANRLTHPSFTKAKIYQVELDRPLTSGDITKINNPGVDIGDKRLSKFIVTTNSRHSSNYQVVLTEGRNRQIRRTFEALGYKVIALHRIEFGPYKLGGLQSGKYQELK